MGEPYLRELVSATCKDSEQTMTTRSTAHKTKGLEFDDVCRTESLNTRRDDFPRLEYPPTPLDCPIMHNLQLARIPEPVA